MMDWMYMAPDLPGDYISQQQLGYSVGEDYRVDPNAMKILESILEKLEDDDKSVHTFRRSLAFSKVSEKDLIPIFKTLLKQAEQEAESPSSASSGSGTRSIKLNFSAHDERLISAVVKVCCNLSTPLECLVNTDEMTRTKEGGQILSEMKQHHSDMKDAFLETKVLKVLLKYMDFLLNREQSKLSLIDCDNILATLTLVRNILHIPTPRPNDGSVNIRGYKLEVGTANSKTEGENRQNCILWSLFCSDLDVTVIKLISSPYVRHWCSILMQVLALIYKDQHMQTLERLLNQWLDTSISESSEDNESNTSPAERCVGESAEELTSMEPTTTDDSSDGNGNEGKKIAEDVVKNNSSDNSKQDSGTSGLGPSASGSSKELDLRSEHSSTDSCSKEPPRKRASTSNYRNYTTLSANDTDRNTDKSRKTADAKAKKDTSKDQFKNEKKAEPMDIGSTGTLYKTERGKNEVYGQQFDQQQESNSTSSNEDENLDERKVTPHANLQKPRPKKKTISPTERRELRRQKLIQRSKANRMKVKATVNHIPSAKDIAELLTEFTVDFLLKGYSTLVTVSRKKLLMKEDSQTLHTEQTHYLWLVTYFLKFGVQLEVDLEQMGPVLSVDTISYLTFEGVRFFEDLELCARDRNADLIAGQRALHLLITALSEFFTALDTYSNFSHLSDRDKEALKKVKSACCGMSELRSLLLLLTRRFNPSVQSRQYLTDVIRCNNMLLVMTENTNFDTKVMTNYLSQFATVEVMRQYGYVLENFRANSQYVNDAIFTMMHHVSGDLGAPESLFVPQVLATFSDMWGEEGTEICDLWTDLIEYVIQKFITTMGTRPHDCASNLLECIQDSKTSEAVDENGFTKSQLESLNYYYSKCQDADDTVGTIIEQYKRSCNVTKTRLSVIQALLSQGIITFAQYMSLMYMKSVLSPCKNEHEGSVIAEVGSEHYDSDGHDAFYLEVPEGDARAQQRKDPIEVLKELLKAQGKESLITWLQEILLEACYVKLNCGQLVTPNGGVVESTAYHFNAINKSIPMVAWNKQQESGLQTETFIMLLHKLGFHLAADVGKLFPRIPHFWSADHILQLIQKLGSIRNRPGFVLKMDVAAFSESGDGFNADDIWASVEQSNSSICMDGASSEKTANSENKHRNSEYKMTTAPPTTTVVVSPDQPIAGISMIATDSGVREIIDSNEGFAMPTLTSSWMKLVVLSKQTTPTVDRIATTTAACDLSSKVSDQTMDEDASEPLERMQLSECGDTRTADDPDLS